MGFVFWCSSLCGSTHRKRPFLIDIFFERMDGYGWIKREIDVFVGLKLN